MFKYFLIVCLLLSINTGFLPPKAYSLVGINGVKNNKISDNQNIKNKNNKSKKKNTSNSSVVTHQKTANIPNFPKDNEKEYKMLFDDGFSNVVNESFQDGEDFDIFINQEKMNEISNRYTTGNDDNFTQMDVIEAEKKTLIDGKKIDKELVTTHRTRVMAYLTIDQMLFGDIFDKVPSGYYINVVNKKG